MNVPCFALSALLLLAACGGESAAPPAAVDAPSPTTSAVPDDVARLARVARALATATDDAAAEAALKAEGYTTETYEAAMFDVAGDPTKAAAFEAARK